MGFPSGVPEFRSGFGDLPDGAPGAQQLRDIEPQPASTALPGDAMRYAYRLAPQSLTLSASDTFP